MIFFERLFHTPCIYKQLLRKHKVKNKIFRGVLLFIYFFNDVQIKLACKQTKCLKHDRNIRSGITLVVSSPTYIISHMDHSNEPHAHCEIEYHPLVFGTDPSFELVRSRHLLTVRYYVRASLELIPKFARRCVRQA